MIVRIDRAYDVHLDDPRNFRAFKIVVELPEQEIERVRAALSERAVLPDSSTAWVSVSWLRRWPGLSDDAGWRQEFDAMIAKARPHGWIDDENDLMKGHIDWKP